LRVALGDKTVVVADPAMRRLYELIRPSGPERAAGAGARRDRQRQGAGGGRDPPRLGPRAGPLVSINCAALPETRWPTPSCSATSAARSPAPASALGLLEAASGGTVFLDEIADLSPAIQAKLLRALEAGKITRLGDHRERPIDIRLVAATHRDLRSRWRPGGSARICCSA
jgi:two-component system response regulator AtoC